MSETKRITAVLTLAAALTATAASLGCNGPTVRASVDLAGGDPNGASDQNAITADGVLVAFQTQATDLATVDANNNYDVYVRHTGTGAITRVTVDTAGGDSSHGGGAPALTAKGDIIAFASVSNDLVPAGGTTQNVYIRTLPSGPTERVSINTSGTEPNGSSTRPSISDDGRRIAYYSFASDIAPVDQNNTSDVFVYDRSTLVTTRVTVDSAGGDPNGLSDFAEISGDGRFVAFESLASDLVPGDTNGTWDIFVHDLQTSTTTRVSVDPSGANGNAASYYPDISRDGHYVTFQSSASNLVPGDGNGTGDIFVRDMWAGTTTRVSVSATGGDSNSANWWPSINADGRYIVFSSLASNLTTAPDTNAHLDVYLRDMVAGTTTRLTQNLLGGETDEDSLYPHINANASPTGTRTAIFYSRASNLVPGDANGFADVFYRPW